MNGIYVVVVTFNGEEWIRQLLRSIRNASMQCHTIVVDNSSSDGTTEIVATEFPEVELIALSENRGFGGGNNAGISLALSRGAEYIFLLNQDAYLVENCIEKLTTFLSNNPDFDIVSPLHCSPNPSRVDIKTFRGYLRLYAFDYISDACRGTVKDHYAIRGINAAAWYARSSMFLRTGGFDPLFFMYGEDDDLISRIEFHGIRFALVPDALVVHLRQSPKTPNLTRWQLVQRRASRTRSSLLLGLKSPGNSITFMFTYILTKGVIAPIAEFIVMRQPESFIASYIALFRVVKELGHIRRNMKLCEQTGPHFLDLDRSISAMETDKRMGRASSIPPMRP